MIKTEASEAKHRKLEVASKSMTNMEAGKVKSRTVLKAGLRNEGLENRPGKIGMLMSDPLVIFDTGYHYRFI